MAVPTTPGECCWTKAEDQLADTLADCQSVQDFLGVADKAAALAGNMFIDTIGRKPEEFDAGAWAALFPHVLIGTPGDDGSAFVLSAVASGLALPTGNLEITLSELIPFADENDPERFRAFKNSIGKIFEELVAKRQMAIQTLTVSAYGANPEKQQEELGVIFSARVTLAWGSEVAA